MSDHITCSFCKLMSVHVKNQYCAGVEIEAKWGWVITHRTYSTWRPVKYERMVFESSSCQLSSNHVWIHPKITLNQCKRDWPYSRLIARIQRAATNAKTAVEHITKIEWDMSALCAKKLASRISKTVWIVQFTNAHNISITRYVDQMRPALNSCSAVHTSCVGKWTILPSTQSNLQQNLR